MAISGRQTAAQRLAAEQQFERKHEADIWGDLGREEHMKFFGGPSRPWAELLSMPVPPLPPSLGFPLFPVSVSKAEQEQWWLYRMLKAASEENSAGFFSSTLQLWLARLGIDPPDGVFSALPKRPGAPKKQSAERTYQIWANLKEKRPQVLAFLIDGADYTRDDAKGRRTRRNKYMKQVRRAEQRRVTQLTPDSGSLS